MNHIEVQSIQTPYGYKENFWVSDGKALPEYLNMWASESQDAYLKLIDSFFVYVLHGRKNLTLKVTFGLYGNWLEWILRYYHCFYAKMI